MKRLCRDYEILRMLDGLGNWMGWLGAMKVEESEERGWS